MPPVRERKKSAQWNHGN